MNSTVHIGSELLIYHVAETKSRIEALLTTLSDHAAPEVHLDCSELIEIDGAGLQLILVTASHLQKRQGCLHLRGVGPSLAEHLQRYQLPLELSMQ